MALLDNLMAFWEFENNGNDAHNVGPYNLTAVNSPTFAAGKVGSNAAAFDGSGFDSVQRFERADHADLSQGDFDFSFAFWLYLETLPAAERFAFAKWGDTVAGRAVRLEHSGTGASNRLRFLIGYDSGGGVSATNDVFANNFGAPPEDTWMFVACGHRATANQIWISVNAGTADTTNHSAGVQDATGPLIIGGSATGDGGTLVDKGIHGRVDQFGYWKRDISSDLATLYNSGNGLSYAAMAGGGLSPAPGALTLAGQGTRMAFRINMPSEP